MKKLSDELFIRTYNIGCGDCIFVRIPDTSRPYHMLIDCGNFFGEKSSELKHAMVDVERLLNDESVPEPHRGCLDLVVATHQHWDHIKGFESELEIFKRIKVRRIWLPIAMKEDHDPGQQFRALQDQVEIAYSRFANEPGFMMHTGLHSMFMILSLGKAEASKALCEYIPDHHEIKPVYVYRGFEQNLTDEEKDRCLIEFEDSDTRLVVLAPENEIDESYMGDSIGLLDDMGKGGELISGLIPSDHHINEPTNISLREFRNLKNRLRYVALLAASKSNHVGNNTSVVLLLEWKGRRLLFTGDAEHESWNIMWDKARPEVSSPVDFMKISHHGSHNGTPYKLSKPDHPINMILNTILPTDNADTAQAVVSTFAGRIRAVKNPVPLPALMNELARRVKNAQVYPPEPGIQPQRTDRVEDKDWIDIRIKE